MHAYYYQLSLQDFPIALVLCLDACLHNSYHDFDFSY